MNKKELNNLIKRYKNDMSCGDLRHIDDLIAALVIDDLTYLNDSILVQYGISNISLGLLLGVKEDKKYKVPSKDEVRTLKNKYERNIKLKLYDYTKQEDVAANTWIDMMLTTGMIFENEKIIPSEYVLGNFVKDYQLSQLLPIEHKKSTGTSKEYIISGKGYSIHDSVNKILDLKKK